MNSLKILMVIPWEIENLYLMYVTLTVEGLLTGAIFCVIMPWMNETIPLKAKVLIGNMPRMLLYIPLLTLLSVIKCVQIQNNYDSPIGPIQAFAKVITWRRYLFLVPPIVAAIRTILAFLIRIESP